MLFIQCFTLYFRHITKNVAAPLSVVSAVSYNPWIDASSFLPSTTLCNKFHTDKILLLTLQMSALPDDFLPSFFCHQSKLYCYRIAENSNTFMHNLEHVLQQIIMWFICKNFENKIIVIKSQHEFCQEWSVQANLSLLFIRYFL